MEENYLKQLKFVLKNGEERMERTGVGTISVFGLQTRYDLGKGFPALTTIPPYSEPIIVFFNTELW